MIFEAEDADADSEFLGPGDSDNSTRALNTHGQTGTCLTHGLQLVSGEGQAGISPRASGQRDQKADRPGPRKHKRSGKLSLPYVEMAQRRMRATQPGLALEGCDGVG
jgi:hypothetical protein